MEQKIAVPNIFLCDLLNECLIVENPQEKGRKFEDVVALCFNSLGNYNAFKAKNKDVFVYVNPSSKLSHIIKIILVECKNIGSDVTADHISSLVVKLKSYRAFPTLGLVITTTKLQDRAKQNIGDNPIIIVKLKELLNYLKKEKSIDDLILDKFPAM